MASNIVSKFSEKDAKRLLLFLIIIEVCLVLVFALDPLITIPRRLFHRFDLNGEATVPSWFSSVQLFLIGILFLFSGNWTKRHAIVAPGFLILVGLGFVFLSMDEAAQVHETISKPVRRVEWVPRFKGNRGVWITVYLSIAFIAVALARRTFFSMWKTYPRQMKLIILGFLVFVTGAVGLEIIFYQYLPVEQTSFLNLVEIGFEEFFEMAGESIMLYGTILCSIQDTEYRVT